MKKDGKSIEEVSEWLEANKLKLQHIFTVDSLAHLKRGGRISGAAAAIGSMIQVKPMLHLDAEGKIKAGDKAKGRKKSLLMLVDYMGDNGVDLAGQRIIISHADCADDAAFIEKKIKERHPDVGEVLIGNVGPVIGAHSGPGTAALFFLGKERA